MYKLVSASSTVVSFVASIYVLVVGQMAPLIGMVSSAADGVNAGTLPWALRVMGSPLGPLATGLLGCLSLYLNIRGWQQKRDWRTLWVALSVLSLMTILVSLLAFMVGQRISDIVRQG